MGVVVHSALVFRGTLATPYGHVLEPQGIMRCPGFLIEPAHFRTAVDPSTSIDGHPRCRHTLEGR